MRRIVLLLAAVACSGNEKDGDGAPTGDTGPTSDPCRREPCSTTSTGPAAVNLAFDLDPDLIAGMSEGAAGRFRGSVFAEADASPVGPNDGATALLDFESDEIDFGSVGGSVSVGTRLEGVEPQIVWILGCLDTQGDDCECGDPITVPNENKFQLTPGDNDLAVSLSLLHPC